MRSSLHLLIVIVQFQVFVKRVSLHHWLVDSWSSILFVDQWPRIFIIKFVIRLDAITLVFHLLDVIQIDHYWLKHCSEFLEV